MKNRLSATHLSTLSKDVHLFFIPHQVIKVKVSQLNSPFDEPPVLDGPELADVVVKEGGEDASTHDPTAIGHRRQTQGILPLVMRHLTKIRSIINL